MVSSNGLIEQLPNGEHQAIVEVSLKGGERLTQRVDSFRDKTENPLTTEEVEAKAKDLVEPVLGAQQARMLIEIPQDLEQLPKVRDLRPLLAIEARHVAGTRG